VNYYIENGDTDPCRNLALEQFVFDRLDRRHSYFMLWRNHNAIIVGKHQNTQAEINRPFVDAHNISVVRRLSGGGAVYHDLGNLNFTFITDADAGGINFAAFCEPVQRALLSFGVPVTIAGRNDMTVERKKFSGNAQYLKGGRIMHHGTILYDSDLGVLSQALNAPDDKIESRGIKSVRSRVTNIRPYMKTDMPVDGFWKALREFMFAAFAMREYALSPADHAAVDELRTRVYAQWDWNYGASPPYNIRKKRRIAGSGTFEALLEMAEGGIITHAAFYGDFFGGDDPAELAEKITALPLEYGALKNAIRNIDISRYFYHLTADDFLSLLLE
jgi:lipoate-protein ligase A